MAKPRKVKVKITSSGMLVSFGYRVRTPAIVELYPNQLAILKSNGTEFDVISNPNTGVDNTADMKKAAPATMYRGGLIRPKKRLESEGKMNVVKKEEEGDGSTKKLVSGGAMKERAKKRRKPIFTTGRK